MGSVHQAWWLFTSFLLVVVLAAPLGADAQRLGNRSAAPARSVPTGYQEPAYARGYADGFQQGRKDARDRGRYDPVGNTEYRNGDQGYNDSYGSREAYKNNYRAGFRQGYEEGYRSGR
jgi:flagellar biosynthesis/type III secretory pathway protein FliH